jgi:hypothetical protein
VDEGGVDGVAEIGAGVDEGAVEVENEETGRWGEGHCFRVIDSGWCKLLGTRRHYVQSGG